MSFLGGLVAVEFQVCNLSNAQIVLEAAFSPTCTWRFRGHHISLMALKQVLPDIDVCPFWVQAYSWCCWVAAPDDEVIFMKLPLAPRLRVPILLLRRPNLANRRRPY